MTSFPVNTFLDLLASRDISVTISDVQKLETVLKNHRTWDVNQLKNIIVAVFAKNLDQQIVIRGYFQQFVKDLGLTMSLDAKLTINAENRSSILSGDSSKLQSAKKIKIQRFDIILLTFLNRIKAHQKLLIILFIILSITLLIGYLWNFANTADLNTSDNQGQANTKSTYPPIAPHLAFDEAAADL